MLDTKLRPLKHNKK